MSKKIVFLLIVLILTSCTAEKNYGEPTKQTNIVKESAYQPSLRELNLRCDPAGKELACTLQNKSKVTVKYVEIYYEIYYEELSYKPREIIDNGTFYCVGSEGLPANSKINCNKRVNSLFGASERVKIDYKIIDGRY